MSAEASTKRWLDRATARNGSRTGAERRNPSADIAASLRATKREPRLLRLAYQASAPAIAAAKSAVSGCPLAATKALMMPAPRRGLPPVRRPTVRHASSSQGAHAITLVRGKSAQEAMLPPKATEAPAITDSLRRAPNLDASKVAPVKAIVTLIAKAASR